MNPTAILALISQLFEAAELAQGRAAALEDQVKQLQDELSRLRDADSTQPGQPST